MVVLSNKNKDGVSTYNPSIIEELFKMSNSFGWRVNSLNQIYWPNNSFICNASNLANAELIMSLADKHDELVAACDKAKGKELKTLCRKILGRG